MCIRDSFVIFLGEDEISAGEVKWKDLQSGEQHSAPQSEAIAAISQALAGRNQGKPIRD